MNARSAAGIATLLLLTLAAGTVVASSPHRTASHHRAARVYDASNFPTRSTSRKSSSFVPHPRSRATAYPGRTAPRAPGVKRDGRGRIARSTQARDEFRQNNPCPSTGWTSGKCPGYVVDHVRALKHGGADVPGNMQWQSVAAAKAKDRVE